uniref:Uncharacterized protein n=1 Tax=Tetranychus urticae TaxID=32264 RepID=T1KKX1_TETUR
MDLADFIPDLPITLANYHSSTVYKVPLSSHRTKTINEHDYLDAGGSGIYVHRPDKYNVKGYKLKQDSIVSSPFYPRCFTLPLIVPDQERYQESTKFNFTQLYSNSLQYDDKFGYFFYADPIRNRITFNNLERDPDHIYKTCIESVSSQESECLLSLDGGPICEISPSFCHQRSDPISLVRQEKSISVIKISENDGKFVLSPEPLIFKPFVSKSYDKCERFWKISKSYLLEHSVAVGFTKDNGCASVKDYDLETEKFYWTCKPTRSNGNNQVSWKHPVNLFWLKNHPKLLAYCELDNFLILDTRDRGAKSMKNIMNVKNLNFVREWERFRGACQLSITDTQFLLSSDHKLILVDSRFPKNNLLQWNHMLPCDSTNSLRFLSSTSIESVGSIITLANKNQACLITVSHFDINITQPQSLHFPLHLSQPEDCWHFSPNVDGSILQKLKNIQLTGLFVQPDDIGYSICQVTSAGDFWVQDFFPKESIDPDQRFTWRRNCCAGNSMVDAEVHSLLERAFSKLTTKQMGEKALKSKGKHLNRDKIVIPEEPELIMPLPDPRFHSTQSNKNDSGDDSNESEAFKSLVDKHVNLLGDDISSLNENQYTLKLLSKWRD